MRCCKIHSETIGLYHLLIYHNEGTKDSWFVVNYNTWNYVFKKLLDAFRFIDETEDTPIDGDNGCIVKFYDCLYNNKILMDKLANYMELHNNMFVPLGIMNSTNNHSLELVTKINKLWDECSTRFQPILTILFNRDYNEVMEHDCGDYFKKGGCVLNYAEDYLMHVADDQDLEVIVNFLR